MTAPQPSPTGIGLDLDGITRRWAGVTALDGVSVRAEPGEMLVLLGPSGCGKSTTLRIIAGLDQPDEGRVLIGGRDVTRDGPAARGLAMVFQSYALFPHLDVARNILFGLEVRGVPAAERRRRLAEAADLLGLGQLLDRRPSQLSGGQQQRVALARALVARAPLCLMDEPLSNLDARLRAEMRREIRALQQRLGLTMVYVTHDQAEAMSMADQVVLMNGGRIEQAARPDRLYDRPETVFAARFIGQPPIGLIAPARAPGLLAGARAEDIRPTPLGDPVLTPDATGSPLKGIVAEREYLGADAVLGIDLDGYAPSAGRLTARVPGHHAIAPGAAVALSIAPGRLHVFDAATGRRVDPPAGTAADLLRP
ncbi:ABC transporter ATP-binding protein [uncultured Tistrella sp.]|uniref:ABC transporter ATP-binding protein n=1 Tax=Tistrella mobilis TaxID=171437 RepID=UPI000C0B25FF|nr:ABC transporter ATP-binding protein [uncultured Tistrella sp.]MAM74369.1 ABC transporter ATP-binding protein [Tistrella sp.]